MKSTTEYMIGNTAVQIVNKGKRICVVDVKKRKQKGRMVKRGLVTVIMAAMLTVACFYVVRLNNQQVILGDSVQRLQDQVTVLKEKTEEMKREASDAALDYDTIFSKAKKLGMKFPKQDQVYDYKVQKSTAVRVKN
ncbi:MAG: hypothetical protein ACLTHH_05525 [Eubacterium sp.]|jgi:hypothetical protein|nr:putative uncharacterized protein [Clostridium sp. CAG:167]